MLQLIKVRYLLVIVILKVVKERVILFLEPFYA